MKIVATSDWHGSLPTNLPDGDVLIIAGDILPVWDHNRGYQARWIREELASHFAALPHEHIIAIAGNHDFVLQESVKLRRELGAYCHYLQDSSVVIDGVKFHGSPWSGLFGNWAFMATESALELWWDEIDSDTDVLVVHGPPFGACDLTKREKIHAGSESLTKRIKELNLKLVVTGHIHEGYGVDCIFGPMDQGRTIVANASLRDENYNPVNEAMVFEI